MSLWALNGNLRSSGLSLEHNCRAAPFALSRSTFAISVIMNFEDSRNGDSSRRFTSLSMPSDHRRSELLRDLADLVEAGFHRLPRLLIDGDVRRARMVIGDALHGGL